jgi:uncharacterized membrane protein (DUF2068 family)
MASRNDFHARMLSLIGAFKLFKGLFLLAVGIGLIKLLNKGTATELYHWAYAIRVEPENHYFQRLLARSALLNRKTLKLFSVGTFFYSALFFTEGIGLLLRKRWAEYFTIIATSSFIPLEIYELARRATFAKEVVLVLNVAIVAYLAINLRRAR